jgi:hypothetical protein
VTDLIVVSSSDGREDWALECSRSINREHVIYVAPKEGGYELGTLRWCLRHTTADRFIFLQDSTVITSRVVFDLITNVRGSICLNHARGEHYSCFLGVYERVVLESMDVPFTLTKREAVIAETDWTAEYVKQAGGVSCMGAVVRGDIDDPPVWHHGRKNMAYDTQFLRKWQGQWGQTPLDELPD